MKEYFAKRITFLQGLSLFLAGFGVAVGNLLLGLICVVLALILDIANFRRLAKRSN